MNAYKLVATAAAVLLTFASIRAIDYNVAPQPATAPAARLALHVTEFAPVIVHPSADELSALAAGTGPGVTSAPVSAADTDVASASFNLVGSALSIPHYSFGQKFGRASKE